MDSNQHEEKHETVLTFEFYMRVFASSAELTNSQARAMRVEIGERKKISENNYILSNVKIPRLNSICHVKRALNYEDYIKQSDKQTKRRKPESTAPSCNKSMQLVEHVLCSQQESINMVKNEYGVPTRETITDGHTVNTGTITGTNFASGTTGACVGTPARVPSMKYTPTVHAVGSGSCTLTCESKGLFEDDDDSPRGFSPKSPPHDVGCSPPY